MEQFYNSESSTVYFRRAEAVNENWERLPYHRLIRDQIRPRMEVLDLGCGSAHAARNLQDLNIRYTGVDWSTTQIAATKQRFTRRDVTFIAAPLYSTGLPTAAFDFVFSTYVIEHLVWPHRFLAEMVRLLRPGGTAIVLAPEFRAFGRMPSLYYGLPIAPLREKLRRGRLISAVRHSWMKYIMYPRLIRTAYAPDEFPFLINLIPTCLVGEYYPDNDATYCVSTSEIRSELLSLQTEDITDEIMRSSAVDLKHDQLTCFVAVRKFDRPGRV
jgi:ubiquinone/menaquinone biosynthesis C-methylase UbiE